MPNTCSVKFFGLCDNSIPDMKSNIVNSFDISTADCHHPYSSPSSLNQYRTPGSASAHKLGSNRQVVCSANKSKLQSEIIEEELAIELKELEIRKRRLAAKKQVLVDYESSDEDPYDRVQIDMETDCEQKEQLQKKYTEVPKAATDCANDQPKVTALPRIRTQAPLVGTHQRNVHATKAAGELPKIEIERFDGNPLMYCKFVKLFQMTVADRLVDDEQRLMYLLHYCRGEAKDAIEHCVFLAGSAGYQKAMQILATQFGRPHDIVQSFMNELLEDDNIGPNDVESLRKLTRKMINCELALKELDREAELNCTTNLKRIVERLPHHLRQKWAEIAENILHFGAEPSFRDLLSFLEKCISFATNCYGHLASVNRSFGYRERNRLPKSPAKGGHLNLLAADEETG